MPGRPALRCRRSATSSRSSTRASPGSQDINKRVDIVVLPDDRRETRELLDDVDRRPAGHDRATTTDTDGGQHDATSDAEHDRRTTARPPPRRPTRGRAKRRQEEAGHHARRPARWSPAPATGSSCKPPAPRPAPEPGRGRHPRADPDQPRRRPLPADRPRAPADRRSAHEVDGSKALDATIDLFSGRSDRASSPSRRHARAAEEGARARSSSTRYHGEVMDVYFTDFVTQ